MNAEILLARLNGVIRTGDGRWSARCPAYPDRSPSLSVHVDEEWLLFHCHAGCAPEAVLAAVGLSWSDLYAAPWTASFRVACAEGAHRARRARLQRELIDGIDIEVERLILHIAADPSVLRQLVSEIKAGIWAAAHCIGLWFLEEAVRVQRAAVEDPTLETARRTLGWLGRRER